LLSEPPCTGQPGAGHAATLEHERASRTGWRACPPLAGRSPGSRVSARPGLPGAPEAPVAYRGRLAAHSCGGSRGVCQGQGPFLTAFPLASRRGREPTIPRLYRTAKDGQGRVGTSWGDRRSWDDEFGRQDELGRLVGANAAAQPDSRRRMIRSGPFCPSWPAVPLDGLPDDSLAKSPAAAHGPLGRGQRQAERGAIHSTVVVSILRSEASPFGHSRAAALAWWDQTSGVPM
jgi:hypothetical protein